MKSHADLSFTFHTGHLSRGSVCWRSENIHRKQTNTIFYEVNIFNKVKIIPVTLLQLVLCVS